MHIFIIKTCSYIVYVKYVTVIFFSLYNYGRGTSATLLSSLCPLLFLSNF